LSLSLLARVLADGAKSLYIYRDIATISLDGLSNTTNWREEKRRYLQANYTRWELFCGESCQESLDESR